MSLKSTIRNSLTIGMASIASCCAHKPQIRIISLHDIPAGSQAEFEKKMSWLKSTCAMISLDEALRSVSLNRNLINVALTFDDGFLEHATVAAPILRRLNIPATFFVPSGSIGASSAFATSNLRRHGTFSFMSAEHIRGLATDPLFEIGGHTMNHVNLGKRHTADELAHEIVDDKAVMEKTVGKPLRFFAYPFGSVKNLHADSISVIRRAGYKAAFTIVPSFLSSARDPYSLGRDSLLLEDSNGIWLARLRGGYDFVSRLKNTFLS